MTLWTVSLILSCIGRRDAELWSFLFPFVLKSFKLRRVDFVWSLECHLWKILSSECFHSESWKLWWKEWIKEIIEILLCIPDTFLLCRTCSQSNPVSYLHKPLNMKMTNSCGLNSPVSYTLENDMRFLVKDVSSLIKAWYYSDDCICKFISQAFSSFVVMHTSHPLVEN